MNEVRPELVYDLDTMISVGFGGDDGTSTKPYGKK